MALHGLHVFFLFVAYLQEPICVCSDLQHPLAHRNSHHWIATSLAFTINDLFIRQHSTKGLTPVDRNLGLKTD